MLLEASGYHVTTAESGEDALELLRTEAAFDVVLLDYQMSGMTGPDVLERIRDDSSLCEMAVIMLTASVLHGEEAVIRGADLFVSKPVDIDLLLKLIEEHLPTESSLSS